MSSKPENDTRNAELTAASNYIEYQSRLVSFLYELMRDHVPPGKVEEILRRSCVSDVKYSNGWLAQYAANVAEELLKKGTSQTRTTVPQFHDWQPVIGGWPQCTQCYAEWEGEKSKTLICKGGK